MFSYQNRAVAREPKEDKATDLSLLWEHVLLAGQETHILSLFLPPVILNVAYLTVHHIPAKCMSDHRNANK